MLTLSFSGENSAASLYLWELTIQCQIASYAFERLKENARIDIERDYDSPRPHAKSAVELLADCSAFLSASGIVAKILFAGADAKNSKLKRNPMLAMAAKRSAALRKLMNVENLPSLRLLGVRNAFEHIDERLDRLLRDKTSERLVWVHLSRRAPPPGIVLKRFDPNTLKLSYLNDELDIAACNTEVSRVQEQLMGAYDRVRKDEALLALAGNGCVSGGEHR